MRIETVRVLKSAVRHGMSPDDMLDVTGMKNRGDLESYEDVDLINKALDEGTDADIIEERIGYLGYKRTGGKLGQGDWNEMGRPENDAKARGILTARFDEDYARDVLGDGPIEMPASLIDDGDESFSMADFERMLDEGEDD